jgi:O-antigen ligase
MIKDYIINIADIIIEIGLLALILFMPLAYGSVEIWSQAIFELFALFIFMIYILKVCIKGDLTLYKSILDLPIAIFFILVVISRFASVYPHMSQTALHRVMAYILVYYVISNNFASFSKLERLSLYIISCATIVSFLGLVGYFNKNILLSIWPYAIFSSFTTTGHFAGYIGTIFPLSLASLWDANISKKIYFVFSSIVITAAALLCQDRGGWFQFISAIMFLVVCAAYSGLLKRKWSILLFIGALFIWGVSFYGFQTIIQRLAPIFTLNFEKSPEATIWERWIYWKDTLKIIKNYPIFGTGIGTFSIIYPQFKGPEQNYFLNYAHQDFLQLTSEMGIMGLAIFSWILLSFFKLGLHIIRNKVASYTKAQVVGSLAGVFGLLVYSLYDFNLHIPSNALVFVILMAMVSASSYFTSSESGAKERSWVNLKLNLIARVFVFFIVACFISFMALSIIKPYLAYLNFEKGQVFEENLQWDKAIGEYNKAKELDPADSSYYYALGNIYTARSHFDFLDKECVGLAINNYNRAIRLNPFQGDYYLALGNLYNILGQKELALKNLNKAISSDPNNEFYKQVLNSFSNLETAK